MEDLELVEGRADRLGALEVQDGGERSLLIELLRVSDEPEHAGPLEPARAGGHGQRVGERHLGIGALGVVAEVRRVGGEDREQPAGQAALARLRHVELRGPAAFGERAVGGGQPVAVALPARLVQGEEDIVMTVEDPDDRAR